MNKKIEKLIKERTEIKHKYELTVEQTKLIEKQLGVTKKKLKATDIKLLKTYFSIKEINPKFIANRVLSSMPSQEEKAIRLCLDLTYPRIRTFYSRTKFWALARKLNYSESGANQLFNRSIIRLRRSTFRRKALEPILNNNKEFLKLTQIDEDILRFFLIDKFFFEINLCNWVFQTRKIY